MSISQVAELIPVIFIVFSEMLKWNKKSKSIEENFLIINILIILIDYIFIWDYENQLKSMIELIYNFCYYNL